jgi:hypothetical protein
VSIGGAFTSYPYATVRLRITDTYEVYEWEAVVGFAATPIRWALLGHAGMQQFFDIELLGHGREVILRPNQCLVPGLGAGPSIPPP